MSKHGGSPRFTSTYIVESIVGTDAELESIIGYVALNIKTDELAYAMQTDKQDSFNILYMQVFILDLQANIAG